MTGKWRVTLGERVTVSAPDGADATPHARKARALVAYLAAKPGRDASRPEVLALLWSDRGRTQARASLRQCLFELRAEAPGLVEAAGEQIGLPNVEVARPPIHGGVWLSELDRMDPGFDRWLRERQQAMGRAGDGVGLTAPTERRRPGWPWAVLAGAVLVAALGGLWELQRGEAAISVRRVVILPWAPKPADDAARAAARLIAANVGAELPTPRLQVRTVDAGDGPRAVDADWVVTGDVLTGTNPKVVTARVRTRRGLLLWSGRIEAGADGIARAAAAMADWTASTLLCAAGGPTSPSRRDEVTTLLMSLCSTATDTNPAVSDQMWIAAARRLVAAAPRDAYAHGLLADALAESAFPQPLEASARAEARGEAERALALDPRTGDAFEALGRMARDLHDFVGADRFLRSGLRIQSDNQGLLASRAELLKSIGQNDEALAYAQKSQALHPGSSDAITAVADLLVRTQSPRAAFALLDKAEDERGPLPAFEHKRFMLLLRGGDPSLARAQAMRMARESLIEPRQEANMLRQIEAMAHPHGAQAEALAAELVGPGSGRRGRGSYRLIGLASIGRLDEAFAVASHQEVDTEIFFRPIVKPMLYDPRFPAVARFQGLWAYWDRTGRWPDVCRDPVLPWRCGGPVNKP